jgi:hypothetical protein
VGVSVGGVTERHSIGRPAEAASPRPSWFKPRRTFGPEAPIVQIAAEPDAPRRGGFLAQLAGGWYALRHLYLGWGMGVSLLLHGSVLILLACIVYHQNTRDNVQFEGIFGAPGDETILDLPLDSTLNATGDSAAPLEFIASTAVSDSSSILANSDRILGALDGQIDGETGDGGEGQVGAMSNVRVPDSAITKGSFTVWTEPEDPLPRQRYSIVIQVKLPKAVKQYRLRDLTGEVRGTDGYFKQIKYSSTERKGVKDGVVQLQVAIPGAVQLIRDTIRIKSDLLKEEQTIEIVF